MGPDLDGPPELRNHNIHYGPLIQKHESLYSAEYSLTEQVPAGLLYKSSESFSPDSVGERSHS